MSIYETIGEDGFSRLTAAFYRRVQADDLLSPMYPQADFAGAQARLRGFLIQRFGGPNDYSRERGHPRLRMRHAPFAIDQAARDRWVALMNEALGEAALPAEATNELRAFFDEAATFMMNR